MRNLDNIVTLKLMLQLLIFYNKKYPMQPETGTNLLYFQIPCEDQTFQNEMNLQLYFHFERMLSKSKYHYGEKSQFFYQRMSRQKIVSETIKYLNYLKENIKILSPQHNEQLIFLISVFNKNNELITNWNLIAQGHKDSTGPANFRLGFNSIKKSIDFKQFTSFNNWNHLIQISFSWCGWFDYQDWRILVENADNFKNLNKLWLRGNNIIKIKEGDIERFQSLSQIDFDWNPLDGQSKEILKRLQLKNKKMKIWLRQIR